MNYDVVIAGGSVAGLFCAREIARNGYSVLVLEEDHERIGSSKRACNLIEPALV